MSEADRQLDQVGTLAEEDGPLLSQSILAKIGKLDLVQRKILQGRQKGEKRSKKRGQSVEFADHRQYAPGDDLRHLDWSIYARLDRLMIKLFLEEEDLPAFVDRLEAAVAASLEDRAAVAASARDPFSWRAVFERVERVWRA